MNRPEEALQRRCVDFLNYVRPLAQWFHIPNGGGRSRAEAGIMKAMGARAGAPDLVFIFGDHARQVELKVGKGRLSTAQRAWTLEALALGNSYEVARSVAELDALLRGWGIDYLREPTGFYDQLTC